MSSFSIPLTGLNASSEALNTIANNLSNMNTTAYKSQNVTFSDLFYQQIGTSGSGDPLEVGAGTQVASTQTNFTPGSMNADSNPTDMAIDGAGFFVVKDGGGTDYTRNGNFMLSSDGTLQTQNGQAVMGYPAANGAINTSAPLTAIQIPTNGIDPAAATTQFSFTGNLDASSASGSSTSMETTVYDSLGVPHVATVTFTKAATPANTWNYSVGLPGGDAAAASGNTGTLTFDGNGNLVSSVDGSGTAHTPPANAAGITFTGMSDGASNLSMTWDLLNSAGQPLLTQTAAASGASAQSQNGQAAGSYKDFSIDSNGVISVAYNNGQTVNVGQLAIALVANEQGLNHLGNGLYATTSASGQASLGAAGSAGRGQIEGETLEGSNVNISNEFSNLIIQQQAFDASSKAITTFNTISQETINMIH